MLFHSMYTFIILTMCLSAQCNSCLKRTKVGQVQDYKQTHRRTGQVRSQPRDLLKFKYKMHVVIYYYNTSAENIEKKMTGEGRDSDFIYTK